MNPSRAPIGALKIKDAAQYLGGISTITVRRLIARGLIKPNLALQGHPFPEPTVRFSGGQSEGFRALGVITDTASGATSKAAGRNGALGSGTEKALAYIARLCSHGRPAEDHRVKDGDLCAGSASLSVSRRSLGQSVSDYLP